MPYLEKKTLLSGSKIHLTEDFSQEVRNIRKRLWELSEQDRARNNKVYLLFDKIKINGCLYKLNWDWTDLVKIQRSD